MNCKRILIADDHFAIRSGVRHILSNSFRDLEFEEAENGSEAFGKIQQGRWDLLILDIGLPDKSGLDLLRQLKDNGNNVPILIFSMYREDQIAVRALRSGAAGYLSKEAADTELVHAVELLCAGRKYISLSVAELLVTQIESVNQPAHASLSNREFQTLIMIGSGKSVSEIANKLSLSVPTISTYRSRILDKMGLKNNSEITHYVIENKLA